jgi:hypothetical protein
MPEAVKAFRWLAERSPHAAARVATPSFFFYWKRRFTSSSFINP